MKVKYLGESSTVGLIDDKDYEVISIERDWYRIVDETDEDYLHPPAGFDVVEPSDGSVPPATRCSLPGPAAD